VLAKLTEQDYIGDKKIGTVVFLADKLEKPVLVEGRPASARPSSPRWSRRRPAGS
jgi:hypothetical protein